MLWQPSNEKTGAKHDKAEAASLSSTFTIYYMALNFNQLWYSEMGREVGECH